MTVTVNLKILRKICDLDNCGYCLCKVDVTCPCEEVFNLKEGKECTCGLYKREVEKR